MAVINRLEIELTSLAKSPFGNSKNYGDCAISSGSLDGGGNLDTFQEGNEMVAAIMCLPVTA